MIFYPNTFQPFFSTSSMISGGMFHPFAILSFCDCGLWIHTKTVTLIAVAQSGTPPHSSLTTTITLLPCFLLVCMA